MIKIALFIVTTLLVGCGANPIMPAHNTSTSENVGMGMNEVGMSLKQGYKLFFAPTFNTTTIQNTRQLNKTISLIFDYRRGLLPWLDFETFWGPGAPTELALKFQPFGTSKAAASGGSFSFSFKISTQLYVGSGNAKAFSTSGAIVERSHLVSGTFTGYSAYLGYRVFQPLLVFFSYSTYSIGIATSFTDGDVDGQDIQIKGKNDYLSFGTEYKMNNFLFSGIISSNEVQIDQDPTANKDELLFSLNSSLLF